MEILKFLVTDIYFVFECVALIVLVIQYKKLKHTIYRYFLPYLIFIVIYEFLDIGDWLYINHSNLYTANITLIVYFLFYTLFLRKLLIDEQYKKVTGILILVTLASSLINMAFFQGFWKLDTVTILLQFSVIIMLVCLYFYQLINSIDIEQPILNLPAFWLNTGLLFFYLSDFLFYSSFAYMAYRNNYHYFIFTTTIINIANVILYSCLSVCFLCFNRNTNSLQFS